MSDYLVELGANPQARRIIQELRLPIPLPQKLERPRGPWEDRPLGDLDVVVAAAPGGSLLGAVADTLAAAGANPFVAGTSADAEPFVGPGEAWGRPPTVLPPGEASEDADAHALVFDASGVSGPPDLAAVYDFFHAWVRRLRRNGRAIVLGRPPESARTPAAAAASRALDGFVRSLAKEVGRRGATANLVRVASRAERRAPPLLRFLLSDRSAWLTGQPFTVTAKVRTEAAPKYVLPLEGKVALVTGAARGIGAETARILAGEGAKVIVLDRPADDGPASRVARDVGGTVLLLDVSDPEAPATLARTLRDDFGGVDVVVHNAGVTRDKTLANMDRERWDQVLDINLGAVVRMTESLLGGGDGGVLRDDGRLVLLSSIAGVAGNFGQTNYAASKAGVIGYVEALAPDLAKRGITVNAVAPGFIETRLTAAIPPVQREVVRRMCALGQGGVPQDIAEAVAFLASPGAAGLTGQTIRVCGGNFVGA